MHCNSPVSQNLFFDAANVHIPYKCWRNVSMQQVQGLFVALKKQCIEHRHLKVAGFVPHAAWLTHEEFLLFPFLFH
jgi:hypothetical protein